MVLEPGFPAHSRYCCCLHPAIGQYFSLFASLKLITYKVLWLNVDSESSLGLILDAQGQFLDIVAIQVASLAGEGQCCTQT